MLDNLLEGSKELLIDAIATLDRSSVRDYVVIGGWCPYLRNTSGIRHPGTLDVDILFRDGAEAGILRPAIEALKTSGFIVSAKHSFQLMMEKNIRGERLIYNLDLLHPSMNETATGMFVDHMELDVPLDDQEKRVKTMTSIVTPNSAVLFQENLYSRFNLGEVAFDLVDFTGLLLTKMDSCQKQKRERDAFDLYIALKSNQIDFSAIRRIRDANSRVENSLRNLSVYLKTQSNVFDKNVALFSEIAFDSPAAELLEAISKS